MSLIIPPAKNYQSPLVAVPSRVLSTPREGNKMMPCNVDWGSMGGANQCVNFNLQNNATLEFSQIVAISVDNSQCGCDVQFVFPDTGETTTIPAYDPKTIIEVFTNQTQFFLIAVNKGAQQGDYTNFSLLNFLPPPSSVPVTLEQQTAAIDQIKLNSTGVTQIVPTTVNGTLQNLAIYQVLGNSTNGGAIVGLYDGTGKTIAAWVNQMIIGTGVGIRESTPINLQGIHVRFKGGLNINVTSTTLGNDSYISVNAYYRIP